MTSICDTTVGLLTDIFRVLDGYIILTMRADIILTMRADCAGQSVENNTMEEDFDQFEKDGLWQKLWRVVYPNYYLDYDGVVFVYQVNIQVYVILLYISAS